MDGDRNGSLLAWLIDLAAAALAGAAVGLCIVLLDQPMAAVPAGAGMLLLSFSALQRLRPEPGRYRLPAFELPAWDDVLRDDTFELTEVEPLLLDQPVPQAEGRGVIRLFPMTPLPTAGELKQRIDAHLGARQPHDDDNVVLLSPDATAALRSALAELKRSLG